MHLRAAVVYSQPFLNPTFNQTTPNNPPFQNLNLRGIEFEIFHQIFINFLGWNFEYVTYDNVGSSLDAIERNETDIAISHISTIHMSRLSAKSNTNLIHSQVTNEVAYSIIYKQTFEDAEVSLLSLFTTRFLVLCLCLTAAFAVLKEIGEQFIHHPKMLTHMLWFLLITIILGLFSNLITTKLLKSKVATKSFSDITNLLEKTKHGKCQIAITENANEMAESLKQAAYDTNQWSSKLYQILREPGQQQIIQLGSRHDLALAITNNECMVGIDYDIYPFYETIHCVLKSEIIKDVHPGSFLYVMNKNTITNSMRQQLDAVLATEPIQYLHTKLSNLYFGQVNVPTCDKDKNHLTDIQSSIHLSIEKIKDPCLLLIAGVVVASLTLILEHAIIIRRNR